MPIYEFECERCGRFEMIFPMNRSDITFIPCETIISHRRVKGKLMVKRCTRIAERVISLTSMQPDKYWAGHMVHGKYVTKRSEVDKNIEPFDKKRHPDYVAKRKLEHVTERKQKHDTELRKFLESEMRQYDISPDGNTVKEKRRYARARESTE